MFKLLNKIFLITFFICFNTMITPANETSTVKFVSLVPAVTEIFYALEAQNNLVAVSTACNYPSEAQKKIKIGDTYFINKEKIIRLNPNYILALDTTNILLQDFKKTNSKIISFTFDTINDIYRNIYLIGKLTGKEQKAEQLIHNIKTKILSAKTKSPKRILYLVQTDPIITIGGKSFITNVIQESGHKSITYNLNYYYPSISMEYAIKSNPDIIVVSFSSDIKKLKKLFPKAKIVTLTQQQKDIINRPGPRIYQAVSFFAQLNTNP